MQELNSKTMGELRLIAKQMGLSGIRAESKEALRARITIMMNPQLLNQLNQNGTTPVSAVNRPVVAEAPKNTANDILAALEPLRGKGLLIRVDDGDKTWIVKKAEAEDSGTFFMPLKVIVRKASEIARARHPAKVRIDGVEMLAG